MSEKELEKYDYDDSLIGFYYLCQQYGAREVLKDFRAQFPDMFEEVLVQINRLPPPAKAFLLR